MFFWNYFAFLMIQQMLAIWSLVRLPFLKPAWTSGSSWFTYCWSLAWRILNITRVWDECNCAVVWAFFGEGKGNPLQYSGLQNSMDCIVGVAKSRNDWETFTHSLEHSLALPFFGIGMKTDLFQSCGHCWVFQICWHIECSTFIASSFRISNSSTEFHQLH